jgi:hypothetical protein
LNDALRNLISMANTMGKITIAQYVVDAAAVSVLWSIGVNFIQGYFCSCRLESPDHGFSALAKSLPCAARPGTVSSGVHVPECRGTILHVKAKKMSSEDTKQNVSAYCMHLRKD